MTGLWLNYGVPALWWVLLIVWIVSARGTKASREVEAQGSRNQHVALMVVAGLLTMTDWVRIGRASCRERVFRVV